MLLLVAEDDHRAQWLIDAQQFQQFQVFLVIFENHLTTKEIKE